MHMHCHDKGRIPAQEILGFLGVLSNTTYTNTYIYTYKYIYVFYENMFINLQ